MRNELLKALLALLFGTLMVFAAGCNLEIEGLAPKYDPVYSAALHVGLAAAGIIYVCWGIFKVASLLETKKAETEK